MATMAIAEMLMMLSRTRMRMMPCSTTTTATPPIPMRAMLIMALPTQLMPTARKCRQCRITSASVWYYDKRTSLVEKT